MNYDSYEISELLYDRMSHMDLNGFKDVSLTDVTMLNIRLLLNSELTKWKRFFFYFCYYVVWAYDCDLESEFWISHVKIWAEGKLMKIRSLSSRACIRSDFHMFPFFQVERIHMFEIANFEVTLFKLDPC